MNLVEGATHNTNNYNNMGLFSRYSSTAALLSAALILLASCCEDVDGFTTTQRAADSMNRKKSNSVAGISTPTKTASMQLYMIGSSTSLVPKIAIKAATGVVSTALAGTAVVKLFLDKPSRTYGSGTVAQEYDEWTEEGILEYY